MVEYALMCSLIAAVLIVAVPLLTTAVKTTFTTVAADLTGRLIGPISQPLRSCDINATGASWSGGPGNLLHSANAASISTACTPHRPSASSRPRPGAGG